MARSVSPGVSVLLPVRDAGGALSDCLDSLGAQTLARHEVIAVDDGSRDDSGERLVVGPKPKFRHGIPTVAGEFAFARTAKDFGHLHETEAGEHLPRIQQINGNLALRRHSTLPLGGIADAFQSAARRSVSNHASSHGPHFRFKRAKRNAAS